MTTAFLALLIVALVATLGILLWVHAKGNGHDQLENLGVQPGEIVVTKRYHDSFATLSSYNIRGLWDPDVEFRKGSLQVRVIPDNFNEEHELWDFLAGIAGYQVQWYDRNNPKHWDACRSPFSHAITKYKAKAEKLGTPPQGADFLDWLVEKHVMDADDAAVLRTLADANDQERVMGVFQANFASVQSLTGTKPASNRTLMSFDAVSLLQKSLFGAAPDKKRQKGTRIPSVTATSMKAAMRAES